MTIKWEEREVQIKDLKDYERNPRRINKDQFENLVRSLKEDGYHQRLIVNEDGTIIGGHQRKRALLEAGFKPSDKIKVLTPLDPLSLEDFKRINIRDNLPYGEYDMDMLAADFDIDELVDWGMAPEMFPDFEKIGSEGLTDDDAVPETPKDPITKIGDVYVLGNHRLMCGDSTSMDAIEKLMDGQKADMVFTDPPYGISLDTDYTRFGSTKSVKSLTFCKSKRYEYEKVIGDNDDFKSELITTIFAIFSNCKEIFIWGADYFIDLIPFYKEGSWVVWDKRIDENLDKVQGNTFELCWSKQKHKRLIARILWSGLNGMDKNTSTGDEGFRRHPTQKPTKLIEWFFSQWGKPNDNVVDLFGGSGSTLIACEKTNRKCFMMEISPHYCDVIVKRWEDYTGKKAELVNP
jgi:DNA modification methylase